MNKLDKHDICHMYKSLGLLAWLTSSMPGYFNFDPPEDSPEVKKIKGYFENRKLKKGIKIVSVVLNSGVFKADLLSVNKKTALVRIENGAMIKVKLSRIVEEKEKLCVISSQKDVIMVV